MKQNYVLQKVRLYHLFHFSYSALGSIILDAYIPKSVFNVHICTCVKYLYSGMHGVAWNVEHSRNPQR